MNKLFLVIWCIALLAFICGSVLAAVPNGANFTYTSSSTAGADNPAFRDAIAGNVTELSITGSATTQSWQGYYGNVSGSIELADSSGRVMYNWSQVTAEGEVYAANSSSVSWSNIGCFNFSANGSLEMNLTLLETEFNISSADIDGVDETFNLNNHDSFATGSVSFTTGQCNNTKIFNNVGARTFPEALLYDTSNNIPVFASILTNDVTGFDANTHDFEMLVLDDGHNGNTGTTRYYFYIELSG